MIKVQANREFMGQAWETGNASRGYQVTKGLPKGCKLVGIEEVLGVPWDCYLIFEENPKDNKGTVIMPIEFTEISTPGRGTYIKTRGENK